jgi:hypothetical protein
MDNNPGKREGHTAVWTGAEMIVWGGYDYDDDAEMSLYLDTGGRYDPDGNSWIPTPTDNCPAGRQYHTAVWTGANMIVWGGSYYDEGTGTSKYLNTGGKYDPTGDAWTTTTTDNSPAGRKYHEAVWTGTRMIVWGGGLDSTFFLPGGQYFPGGNGPGEAGKTGGEMRASKGGGTTVLVAYTPANCATDHAVYWGQSPILGSLVWTDGECARGADGTTDFDPGADPPAGEFFYFVIAGDDGTNEGSYGKDSSSTERPDAPDLVDCHPQQLAGACP